MIKRFIALFVAVLLAQGATAQTINNLGAGAAVKGTDIFPAYQGANPATGVTAAQIQAYVAAALVPSGPGDVAPTGLVIAQCLRRCISTYTGPLVTVVRASDSAVLNIAQDALGNLDQAMCAAFQGASTLAVSAWFDQTINGNNAVMATSANRPTLVCSVPQLAGLPAIFFTGCTSAELQIPSSPSWQGWASGASTGTVLHTEFQAATTGGCSARRWEIGSTDPNSVHSIIPGGSSTVRFSPGYSTSNGNFITSTAAGTTSANVIDEQYQWTLTTNVPTVNFNGAPSALGTNLAPGGTAGVDNSLTWTIGNNGGTPGSSFPGYMVSFLVWKTGPGAIPLEAARKSEGAYYGIAVQ